MAVALTGCERSAPPPPAFKSIDITGAEYARDFDLPDVDGKRRRLADFKGSLAVVFFGYTQCPDVCPTTMMELAQIKKELGADGARVQGIFISVDPERDTPEVLKAYVGAFSPDFVALRGSAEETAAAAKAFKVFFAKVPGQAAGSYTMDHTAGSYVFDATGRVRLFTRYGMGSDTLKSDLQLLLKG
ncbi:putative Cytochrome oxidase biogenesis protein Sco1/SenC/PrrC, copper metallochaperone [Rubrivivax sp. A210]|nr:putative Cytochrome oxidase biogenesis protein Sco1/SenC/PrrC, copper metallochaperone [Rubrivivax sp. A210]